MLSPLCCVKMKANTGGNRAASARFPECERRKAAYTTYPVEKYFKNTDIPYEDGQHILYVNAAVNDGSETAKLMQYFKTADPNDMRHGELSERIHLLKCEEGGYPEMCEASERIFNQGVEHGERRGIKKGIKQGIEIGVSKGELNKAHDVSIGLASMGMSIENIAKVAKVEVSLVRQWLDEQ